MLLSLLFTSQITWPVYVIVILLCFSIGIILIALHKRNRRTQTQRQQLEHEIAHQKKIVNEQARKLSREKLGRVEMFRNLMEVMQPPLKSMVGLNQAIMESRYGFTNNNIKGASRIALKNGTKIQSLVDDICELASLKNASLNMRERQADLHSYLQNLYEEHISFIPRKNISIGFSNQISKGISVSLDCEKFEKVFVKLVFNAIQSTPIGGQIIITVDEGPECAFTLTVEDTGEGFARQHIEDIRDCYFRSDCETAFRRYGLLPALLQAYAELFQGTFDLYSEEGKGTTWLFSFPLNQVTASIAENIPSQATGLEDKITQVEPHTELIVQVSPPKKLKSLKRHRGLIIGRKECSLKFIQENLSKTYHTLFARGENEALSLLENYGTKIDFILCCETLPSNDGFELIREIKSDDRWRYIPWIIATDNIKVSQKIKTLNIGIDDYLVIPFSQNDLLSRIEHVIFTAKGRDEWHVNPVKKPKKNCSITATDLSWLIELEKTIQREMSSSQFNLSELAYLMATSERQLFRKVKQLTGQTPNKYLREMRLYTAKKLLEEYVYDTVAEVSYAVGFQDAHYFSKIYQKRFNKWPSEYLLKAKTA